MDFSFPNVSECLLKPFNPSTYAASCSRVPHFKVGEKIPLFVFFKPNAWTLHYFTLVPAVNNHFLSVLSVPLLTGQSSRLRSLLLSESQPISSPFWSSLLLFSVGCFSPQALLCICLFITQPLNIRISFFSSPY